MLLLSTLRHSASPVTVHAASQRLGDRAVWEQLRIPGQRRKRVVPLRRHGLPLTVRCAARILGALQPRLSGKVHQARSVLDLCVGRRPLAFAKLRSKSRISDNPLCSAHIQRLTLNENKGTSFVVSGFSPKEVNV